MSNPSHPNPFRPANAMAVCRYFKVLTIYLLNVVIAFVVFEVKIDFPCSRHSFVC